MYVFPTLVGVVAGVATLRLLITQLEVPLSPGVADSWLPRRQFLLLAGAALAVAAAAGAAGKFVGQRIAGAVANREDFVVPTAADPAPPIPAGADIAIAGASTYITPNDDFYRIDTALLVPQLTTDSWELRIHGMVDREMTLSFDDLVARTPIERVITLTCVSNEVGGVLAGNAKWIGYPMKDLLDEVGVHPDADMLLSTSVDGFTVGTPVEIVIDGRDAILAVAMNGEPLPFEHGYPVRAGRSRSVRFRLRHQVGDGVGTHAFRQGRGLLDPARLGCAGTDQDVPRVSRCRQLWLPSSRARCWWRETGLGAASRDREGRGSRRQR